MKRIYVMLALVTAEISLVALSGCSFTGEPRPRLAGYPTSTIGSRFVDANNIGKHSYGLAFTENAGMAYTCKGGHIDMDHLRIAADYTKYLSEKVYPRLTAGAKDFSFKLNIEPSRYLAQFEYPTNWLNLSKQEREGISKEISIELGEYLTYTMVNWHEILTWYGFRSVGVFPEFPSAFSWEDSYSNLLGTRLAAVALKSDEKDFDKAMTFLIKKELEDLGACSAAISKHASEKMRGKWFTGIALPDIKERNFDIGLDDGYVTPTLVPGICADAKPQSYPAPSLEKFREYGFSIKLKVEPRIWERDGILKLLYPDGKGTTVKLPDDLPIIFDDMKAEAKRKGYTVMPQEDGTISAK